MRKFGMVFMALLILTTLFFLGKDFVQGENVTVGIEVGQRAPNFSLADLDGVDHSLEQYKGKVIMLNFWSITCPPCVEEMPHMQKAYEKLKDQGFQIIAINLDNDLEKVEEFLNEKGIDFLVLKGDSAVPRKYMVRFIPKTLFIDTEGIITYEKIGALNFEEIVVIASDIISVSH